MPPPGDKASAARRGCMWRPPRPLNASPTVPECLALAHSYPPDYLSLDEAFTQALIALEDCIDVRVILSDFQERPGPETAAAHLRSDQDDAARERIRALMCDAF